MLLIALQFIKFRPKPLEQNVSTAAAGCRHPTIRVDGTNGVQETEKGAFTVGWKLRLGAINGVVEEAKSLQCGPDGPESGRCSDAQLWPLPFPLPLAFISPLGLGLGESPSCSCT